MRYEHVSFELLLQRMLKSVPDSFDKREGSVIYDALAPAAIELKHLYIELDLAIANSYADTADREHLILLAKERGITPKPATFAKIKAVFNIDIPIGSRFSCEELNYIVEEKLAEEHTYLLRCEEVGTAGNKYPIGRLIPIETIEGLQSAELTQVLIPGEEEEDTEAFRERYIETLRHEAYGGNILDYKRKVNALDGVGAVKVHPVWNGGGTVKVVFIDTEYNVPTPEMVEKVQEILDPVPYRQQGVGVAPIGHYVTVEGAVAEEINISMHISFAPDKSWSSVSEKVKEILSAYFLELRKHWASKKSIPLPKETPIVIRISQIESRILDIEGIIDIENTTINGQSKNKVLDQNQVPKLGEVSAT